MKEAFEKIKERLEEYRHSNYLKWMREDRDEDKYFFCMEATREIIEIVNQVAEELFGGDINVGSKDGWIPCSERLPENTDNVIITTVYGVLLMAFISTNKKWCYLNGKRIIDSQDAPIAWQPLPAPYQPKGEQCQQEI